jgi:hypothetical protein
MFEKSLRITTLSAVNNLQNYAKSHPRNKGNRHWGTPDFKIFIRNCIYFLFFVSFQAQIYLCKLKFRLLLQTLQSSKFDCRTMAISLVFFLQLVSLHGLNCTCLHFDSCTFFFVSFRSWKKIFCLKMFKRKLISVLVLLW